MKRLHFHLYDFQKPVLFKALQDNCLELPQKDRCGFGVKLLECMNKATEVVNGIGEEEEEEILDNLI